MAPPRRLGKRRPFQARRRAISRGERPLYRVRLAQGRWMVEGCPWLSIDAGDRLAAYKRTREVVAAWLEIDPAAFDVELVEA